MMYNKENKFLKGGGVVITKITFFHTQERNFSNVLYKDIYDEVIDIHKLPGTHIMCTKDTLNKISEITAKVQQGKLFYLGNGNYHYLTLALLGQIKEPFTLVLFDHHNDAGYLPYPNMISCGSWVQHAVEDLPYLQDVFIIGANAKNIKQAKSQIASKINVLNEEQLSKGSLKEFISKIKTKNIYLSIDRDILSEKVVQTNWSQGNVDLNTLLKSIQLVGKNHFLIGADVCGDIVWDYRTMNRYRNRRILEQSVAVNKELFDVLKKLVI